MSHPPWKLEGEQRRRIGRMTHPARGILHGTAALTALVAGTVLAIVAPGDVGRRLSLVVFTVGLVGLFTVSALYHSVPWKPIWKRRWQRLDHTMIHVLIAGTFTPIAFIVLDGWLRVATLAAQWGIVAFGIVHNLVLARPVRATSIGMQLAQGWMALALLWPLMTRVSPAAVTLIMVGGLLYTAGVAVMVTGHPKLWPQVFSSHEVFHVMVVAASALHFIAIARYVSGYGV